MTNVNTIVPSVKTGSSKCTRTGRSSGNLSVDVGNEVGGDGSGVGGNSIVVDLATDKDGLVFKMATVEIAFMSSGRKAKSRTFEDGNNKAFPEGASFGVTLESPKERENMGMTVKENAIAFEVPGDECIVEFKVTLFRGWRRMLKGVRGVGKGNNLARLSSKGKEQSLTGLFDTRGIRLGCIAEIGGGTFRAMIRSLKLSPTLITTT